MESIAKIISSLASLGWPILFAFLIFRFSEQLRRLIDSAAGRKFTIKIAGNELTMEEISEQQRILLSDLQTKLIEIEKKINLENEPVVDELVSSQGKRMLWVDDNPRNNSLLIATLEGQGIIVDTALSTEEGVKKFKSMDYDFVVSDMARRGNDKAGIDLVKMIRVLNPTIPFFLYCGAWAAKNMKQEALDAGVTQITASSATLLTYLQSGTRDIPPTRP